MNTAADHLQLLLPLAQRDAWENLGNRFSGDHAQFQWTDLLALASIILAGVALVWLLRWLYNLQQARQLSSDPRHMFADLCKAHRLGRLDRKQLELLSQQLELTMPATLFVRPDLFDPQELMSRGLDDQQAAQYAQLSQKLFAGVKSLEAVAQAEAATPSPTATECRSPITPVTQAADLPTATISITQN